MEFHNVKLLPKGLPEIMAQFTPYDIYDKAKFIVFPRKGERGIHGQAHSNDFYREYIVSLWPTVILFNPGGIGTFSFQLWQELLRVAMHEIGHWATRRLYGDISDEQYKNDSETHSFIEKLANDWQDNAFDMIKQRDTRLGQPTGRLTGYPGVLAYRRRSGNFKDFDRGRVEEWRALQCDAQVRISDITHRVHQQIFPANLTYAPLYDPSRVMSEDERIALCEKGNRETAAQMVVIHRAIRRARKGLNITRHYTSKRGWQYRMFNYNEATAVYNECLKMDTTLSPQTGHYEWQQIGSFWELVEVDKKARIPKAQRRFKIKA